MYSILTQAHRAKDIRRTLGDDPAKITKLSKQVEATKKFFISPVIIQMHHVDAFLSAAYKDIHTRELLQAEFCIGKPNSENDFITRIKNSIVI